MRNWNRGNLSCVAGNVSWTPGLLYSISGACESPTHAKLFPANERTFQVVTKTTPSQHQICVHRMHACDMYASSFIRVLQQNIIVYRN